MSELILIAGPCVIESEENAMLIAEKMKAIAGRLQLDYYFKASFDKANRTSISSYRGPGIDKGLKVLAHIKQTYNVKIATDIHEPWQAEKVAETADMLQIPAFLCRQTDLVTAAAKTGRLINVKKAQFLAPKDMKNVVEKIETAGNHNIMLCERGTSFGYNALVVDMTGFMEWTRHTACSGLAEEVRFLVGTGSMWNPLPRPQSRPVRMRCFLRYTRNRTPPCLTGPIWSGLMKWKIS